MVDANTAINSLISRLKKLGIEIELSGNLPWIYLEKVNGHKVYEKYYSDHAFTIGFAPIRSGTTFKFLDISGMFKVIRDYRNGMVRPEKRMNPYLPELEVHVDEYLYALEDDPEDEEYLRDNEYIIFREAMIAFYGETIMDYIKEKKIAAINKSKQER